MKLEIGSEIERRPFKARRPSVAIVVPNYNHAKFLSNSLTSIASQTTPPQEVLIIDDASTDDSVRIIDEFLASHPTWKSIRHDERLGVNVTQNEGIRRVHTDWILFLGADDKLHASYLTKAVEQLSRCPDTGLVCACVELIGQRERNTLRPPIIPSAEPMYFPSEMYKRLLRFGDNYHIGTVTMYRRLALIALGGFDPGLESLADGVLARQIAVRHGFNFIPEVLGRHNRHAS
jgi:glycosyltransferase involved in cell wall biosynthesis